MLVVKNVMASSLVEVLVSSVILSLTLSIAFFIFINVTRTSPSLASFKWGIKVDELLQMHPDESVTRQYRTNLEDGYQLLRMVTAHNRLPHLYKVQVTVLDVDQRVVKEKSAWIYRYERNRNE